MTNIKGFSVSWTNDSTKVLGTKPPHPQFKNDDLQANVIPIMNLPSSSKLESMPVGLIQSGRQPYAAEHAYTRNGGLSTRLGTNLGA